MTDDKAAPINHPDPTFIVKPFLASQGGEYCIGIAVEDPGKQVLLWRHPEGHWVRKDEVEFTQPDPTGHVLRYWARDAIERLECGISQSSFEANRYRAWYHETEGDAVCALGLRIALGMEIPTDMQDIAAALVNARLDDEAERLEAEDPGGGIGGIVFILADSGGFLMEERDDVGNFPNGLFFPAGKREAGENLNETLTRELHEELHVVAHDPWPMALVDRYAGLDVTDNQYKMLPYLIRRWVRSDGAVNRAPSFTDKGNPTAWVQWEKAIDNCCPPVREMAREAARLMGWSG